jgi:hypothetical protein
MHRRKPVPFLFQLRPPRHTLTMHKAFQQNQSRQAAGKNQPCAKTAFDTGRTISRLSIENFQSVPSTLPHPIRAVISPTSSTPQNCHSGVTYRLPTQSPACSEPSGQPAYRPEQLQNGFPGYAKCCIWSQLTGDCQLISLPLLRF